MHTFLVNRELKNGNFHFEVDWRDLQVGDIQEPSFCHYCIREYRIIEHNSGD